MPPQRPNVRPGQRPVHRPVRPQPPKPAPPPPRPPLAGRSRELNSGAPPGFLKAMPRPLGQRGEPVLYAVIGTWHEGDVIAATVKNCFANGCTKVFVVDNDSPDDTVKEAESAGAVVATNYKTQFYDDDLRLKLMNDVMQEVTVREKLPELWWLSLDADEFPCGPSGMRVLDFLHMLDPRANCVGANAVDLYPTAEPHYVRGMHPADCMAEGMRRKSARGVFCDAGHWKHPLLRYQDGLFDLAQTRGSHIPFARDHTGSNSVREPAAELIMFHAPIRAREDTFRRLQALCTKQDSLGGHHRSAGDDHATQDNGAIKRWRCLEHVYAGRWDQVELPHSQIYGNHVTGIALFPWRRIVPGVTNFPRWYDHASPEPAEAPTRRLGLPLV